MALQDAAEEFWADREFMLEAVRQNGLALQYAAAELRADREIVQPSRLKSGKAPLFAL